MKCAQCGVDVPDDAKFCGNCGSSVEQSTKETEEAPHVYCWKCGRTLSDGAIFCPHCGTSVKGRAVPRLEMADWGKRFLAWLIDIILLGFILAWITLPGYVIFPTLRWIPFVDLGTKNLIYFLYWMLMDSLYGQSLGKMVMNIKVTKLNGQPVGLPSAAIESIGKAFLLPIDCIIGWILYGKRSQRLFNYISETIVVKV